MPRSDGKVHPLRPRVASHPVGAQATPIPISRRAPSEVEEWSAEYTPQALRQRSSRAYTFLTCMDAVSCATLREHVVRDVNGVPYSPWAGDPSPAKSVPLLQPTAQDVLVDLSRWKLPPDTMHKVFSPTAKPLCLTTASDWINLCLIDEGWEPPKGLPDYSSSMGAQEDKRAAKAKPRSLLTSWIVHRDSKLSFVVAGEAVAQTTCDRVDEEALKNLFECAVRMFTPHVALTPGTELGTLKGKSGLALAPLHVCSLPKQPSAAARPAVPVWEPRVEELPGAGDCSPMECCRRIFEHNSQSPGPHIVVVDDAQTVRSLRAVFSFVWPLSECEQRLALVRFHEFEKIFLVSAAPRAAEEVRDLFSLHRSRSLERCTVFRVPQGVQG